MWSAALRSPGRRFTSMIVSFGGGRKSGEGEEAPHPCRRRGKTRSSGLIWITIGPVAIPPNCCMGTWTRHNWILIAWYAWVATLVCGVVYFLFG